MSSSSSSFPFYIDAKSPLVKSDAAGGGDLVEPGVRETRRGLLKVCLFSGECCEV